MKRVLFIDRDGTIIIEPKDDYQVDSLEKLEFYPTVFKGLGKISEKLEYELVIVTNQDGLGTASYPEDTFWPAQNKMIKAFENEGIVFSEIFIDRTFAAEGAETRKPTQSAVSVLVLGDHLARGFVACSWVLRVNVPR